MVTPPAVKVATRAIGAVLLTSMSASGATERYPRDVATFIQHVADCVELANKKMDAFGLAEYGCFHFEAQRTSLVARYRKQPEVVGALKGVSVPPAFR